MTCMCGYLGKFNYFKDLLEAVVGRRREAKNAEVADEARGDWIASPSWRSTGCSDGHVLKDTEQEWMRIV